ncbi:MAG: 3-isopropylmalate dehydratase small subunit, partial [Candidatus Omnitrophica bacterium]|nr:3-isopropylmalate dehydratase small subunit [Candidatus Omnitrophota bacterium]
YTCSTGPEILEHLLEDLDPDFAESVKSGDIIIAGENFGCGSSREHAPISIKAAGVSCVIAKSFARIFYRNCINIGLPIFTNSQVVEKIKTGDKVEVNVTKGEISKVGHKKIYKSEIFPEFIKDIISAGGLMNSSKLKTKSRAKPKAKTKTKKKK